MAEITGRIYGAYREEPGFLLDGSNTPVSITEIVTMLLSGQGVKAQNGLIVTGDPGDTVELGGTLISNTIIDNQEFFFWAGKDNDVNDRAYFVQDSVQRNFALVNSDEDHNSFFSALPHEIVMHATDKSNDIRGTLGANSNEVVMAIGVEGLAETQAISVLRDQIKITGVRTYANDAAAQADTTLENGGVYRLNADPVLRIKI